MQKAWFLDRDGTIIEDKHYLSNPDDVVILPGVIEALCRAQSDGFLLIIITNQSGIARGYFTAQQADAVDKRLFEELSNHNILITQSYRCPHLPEGNPPYNVLCNCRKPNTGMFEQAIADYQLNPSLCIACGDKSRDVEHLSDVGIPKANTGIIDGIHYKNILDFYNMIRGNKDL